MRKQILICALCVYALTGNLWAIYSTNVQVKVQPSLLDRIIEKVVDIERFFSEKIFVIQTTSLEKVEFNDWSLNCDIDNEYVISKAVLEATYLAEKKAEEAANLGSVPTAPAEAKKEENVNIMGIMEIIEEVGAGSFY